jgi:hypothetical protein
MVIEVEKDIIASKGTSPTGRSVMLVIKYFETFKTEVKYTVLAWTGFELTTLVVIGTDCIGSYKSNYHTITTTTAPGQETTVPLNL